MKVGQGMRRFLFLFFPVLVSFMRPAHAAELRHFDVPSGPALQTLNEFQHQSGLEMLYRTDAVSGFTTAAIQGDYTDAEALTRILEGSGLEAHFNADRTFAAVVVPGDDGPADELAAMSERGSMSNEEEPGPVAEVQVTGTHLRGVIDAVAPLVQRREQDARRAAYASAQDIVASLPMVTRAGPSELFDPGGNFGRGTGVNLRGLGSPATLVLVDGKRLASSGSNADFTDISHIPMSAVERIDVLPDGASALYGADAIAGVVNFVLKDNIKGAETSVRWGGADGGGAERVFAQLLGTQWDTGKAMFVYQYMHRGALAAGDRRYSEDSDKRPFGGTDFRSLLASPGNIFDPRTGRAAFAISSAGASSTLNLENSIAPVELMPDTNMHSAFARLRQDFTAEVSLSAQALFTQRDIRQDQFAVQRLLAVPASNPFAVNPFGDPVVAVGYSFVRDLGPVVTAGHTRYASGSVGLGIKLTPSWRANFSAEHATEAMNVAVRNEINSAALAKALADPDADTAFDAFGRGGRTNPATIDAIRLNYRQTALSRLDTFGAIADGPVVSLPAGDAKLALGIARRIESFARNKTTPGSEGESFRRVVDSAFGELAIPLVGQPREVLEPRVGLSLAARVERYESFEAAFAPKIGLEAVLSQAIKLRGSWGKAFRAPSMLDLFDRQQNAAGFVQVRDPAAPGGKSLVLVEQGSNPALENEHAQTQTVGVDLAPTRLSNFMLSLTYFRTRYSDRVYRPGPPLTIEEVLAAPEWAALVTRNPDPLTVTAICESECYSGPPASQCAAIHPSALIDARARNLASTIVDGVDVGASYRFSTRAGQFGTTIEGTWLNSYMQRTTAGAAASSALDEVGNPLSRRLRATLGWEQRAANAGLSATLAVDYSGASRNPQSIARASIASWTTVDFNVEWRAPETNAWASGWDVGLNAANLFDRDPPFVDLETGYDVANTRPYGRVVSLYVGKRW